MAKLQGRIALVTGGGRGIGHAICRKLASEGAMLVVNDLDSEPALRVVGEIEQGGGRAIACPGSVTDADFAERAVALALDAYGDLHIVINNAGYTDDSVIHKMSDEQFDAMYDVHVKAPFRILRAAGRHIREAARRESDHGGALRRKVVNIASVSALGGNPGQVNYAAAKAAVIGMTRTLAKEWGRYGVNVNCVAFGYIETRLTEALVEKQRIVVQGRDVQVGIPKDQAETIAAMIPLGRAGTPEDAANGVYLFCIPESDYISGQVVVVGGGLTI